MIVLQEPFYFFSYLYHFYDDIRTKWIRFYLHVSTIVALKCIYPLLILNGRSRIYLSNKTSVIVEIKIFTISVLGESDLVYTETLLGIGRNEFKDKTILILGGGDGGILHELLKQSPAYVLMAEVRLFFLQNIISCIYIQILL